MRLSVVVHTFNLSNQKQADLCESEASLIYKEIQVSQSYILRPCLFFERGVMRLHLKVLAG